METVKAHFEEEANEFDQIILKLVPYYSEMVRALVAAIPHNTNDPIKVIDLGCGTGTIAKAVKERFPNSRITCLDLAENMIEAAKTKLSAYQDITYQVAEFTSYDFEEKYDVIISSLALHHIVTDAEKIAMYKKLFQALNIGGVFYNADVVLGATGYLQELYIEEWKNFMLKSVSEEEIETKWLPKYYSEDHPAKLTDHLEWMKEAGFSNIDVVRKYYGGAVWGGIK
ncbi:class I SAM-dependent methyltransferase [Candidatus Margulisiibacteriota bacterium]